MAYVEDLGNDKYKIYVDIGYDSRGKRRRRTKTVTATSKRNLNKQVREFELKCMQEVDEPIENISFEGFVKQWIENHVKTNLKLTSYQTYEHILNRTGLLDYFSKMKLKDIKKIHIVEYLAQEKNKPLLPDKFLVLKSIFAKAVEWEVIKENPTNNIKQPKRKKKEVNYYTEEELNHLFKVLENVYPKHRIIIKLAAIGGLRRAEILGIREESINYEKNYIYVDKQLRYDKYKQKFYLSSVKNGKPRYVYFPEKFMKELNEYHLHFKKQRMQMGNLWTPLKDEDGNDINLLLVKENGYPTHLNTVGNEWNKIIKRYNLKKITFHELRHSCASLMVKKGVNFKIIQERLGHSNIGITLDLYSHLEEELHKESTNAFADIL